MTFVIGLTFFFKDREERILLGGHLTHKILLEQGVPQGDMDYIQIPPVTIFKR